MPAKASIIMLIVLLGGLACAEEAAIQVEFQGKLDAKTKDAPKGVAAQMRLAPGRKAAAEEERKTIDLYAEGEMAAKLISLSREHSRVKISGVVTRNGVQVQRIEEEAAENKEEKNKDKKERKEKRKNKPEPPQINNTPVREVENKDF
jgi:hypothetical protein